MAITTSTRSTDEPVTRCFNRAMEKLVLLVHPDAPLRESCRRILGREGFRVESVHESRDVVKFITEHKPSVLLTGIRMPGKDGFELLEQALAVDPTVSVIAITTHANIPGAVRFLKCGGTDYLAAPFQADQLIDAVRGALSGPARTAAFRVEARPWAVGALDSILGTSQSVLQLKHTLLKVARTDANVLIQGETGTGKELVARAIHELSPRGPHTFLPVDCAALPPTLLESELFGHEKGAFTGADRSRHGLFEAANRGTIFLDEIGELDVSTQSKLFRVLQEGRIRQIGGRRDTVIDVRVIAATNRDLAKGLQDGTFREELYFRLNVVPLYLPPLRKRREDIPILANHFFAMFKSSHRREDLTGMDPSFMSALLDHSWPGNIRELRNALERAVVLAEGPVLTLPDFLEPFSGTLHNGEDPDADWEESPLDYFEAKEKLLESFDRKYFQKLLATCSGNLSEAARRSGIGRKTLYNKLNRVGIIPFDSQPSE